jgi:hypothetical protein
LTRTTGQGTLNGIANLKVGPKTQHPTNFGVTLLDNVPQKGGGFSVGREYMPLQSELDDTMHNRENEVADGQL